MSLPIFLSQMLAFTYTLVDTFFISLINKHSTALLSGTGLVFAVYLVIFNLSRSLFLGNSSVTARIVGGGDKVARDKIGDSSLFLTFCLGVVILTLGLVFGKELILGLAGSKLSADTIRYGIEYFYCLLPGMVLLLFTNSLGGILQGEGQAKKVGWAGIIASIINIVLNPLFIFCLHLGVKGSALATSCSIILTLIYYLWLILHKKTTIPVGWKWDNVQWNLVREVLHIGIPASIGMFLINISALILNNVVGSISETAMNAWVLVSRTDQLYLIPAYSIGLSTIPMIGQNYGRRNFERSNRIFRVNIGLCVLCSMILTFFYIGFSRNIFSFFSSIPAVIDESVNQVQMLAFTTIGLSGITVISCAFQATRRPMPNLVNNIVRMILSSFPLGLSWMGIVIKDIHVIYFCFGTANVIAFIIALSWGWRHFNNLSSKVILNTR
jgi:putative MATE family efflux protein